MVYLVRYEEISVGDAVELLRERDGWFDGDSRCVIVIGPERKGGKDATDMAET
ncbi:MAG: hypothetical protein MOIL_01566 [Candidatus Methanolliviera sp. GoM_oil]|nr:MAG: hypothetical protein MOIL_01566 [Candidatus Methanolliviera sp. GoM_oil]